MLLPLKWLSEDVHEIGRAIRSRLIGKNDAMFGRSDPLIANTRVEHAQVPDQRPIRDQWIAPAFERHSKDVAGFGNAIEGHGGSASDMTFL
jgi:hypothetical protein